jgi:uncharacterized protein (DUF2336 family)
MIVRNFLSWAQSATAAQRAEGAGALARAYLYSDLEEDLRKDMEIALLSMLDDPSPLVRRAISESVANSEDAPHALVSALASDQSDIAAPVLSRSPLLSEAELIDCAAIGDAFAQSAIALRFRVPSGVAAAIAEVGAREAAISLCVNPGADIPEFSLSRMIERFGDDGEMREALLTRDNLPPSIRSELVDAAASSLAAFVVNANWLSPERAERLARESRDKANIIIVADAATRDGREGVRDLVEHLRLSSQLTASLVLRALLSGNLDLFEVALTELSGQREERVAGLVRDYRGAGFAALFARAGMPKKLLPAFRAALEAQRVIGRAGVGVEPRLSLMMIQRVIKACNGVNDGELDRLVALLRRFELEAAMDEVRAAAPRFALAPPPRLAPLPAPEPAVARAA